MKAHFFMAEVTWCVWFRASWFSENYVKARGTNN